MPEPTPKQKLTITLYVIVLVLVIGSLWIFFFKKELSKNLVNSSKTNISSSWNSLVDIFSDGQETIDQLKDNFKELNDNQEELDLTAKTKLLEAVNEKLDDKKINQLAFWENDNLKLFYPDNWFISETDNVILLTTYDSEDNLLPDTRSSLTFTNYSNPESLSKEEWLITLENNSLAYSVESLTLGDIESLKYVTNYPEINSQIVSYLIPRDNNMLVIKCDIINGYLDEYYITIIDNIINSIILK